jgi:hypothetical protein
MTGPSDHGNTDEGRSEGSSAALFHCTPDYKAAIDRYAQNPSEALRSPGMLLALVVLLSIAFALYFGYTDGLNGRLRLRAITCWEIIAILDTFIFSIFYFKDLWDEAGTDRVLIERGAILIGVAWIANVLFLLLALTALIFYDHLKANSNWGLFTYFGYLILIFVSFLIFAVLDLWFARKSKAYNKVREYWCLGLFVDGPATLAFMLVLVYLIVLTSSGRTVSTDIISGAIVMQMLIADILYLLVASNFHHWFVANHLSKGTSC